MVRIEDLDYQTQNVIFVVKHYEDLFDIKKMPKAIQMVDYLNAQDLRRRQRGSISEDTLKETRSASHLAVSIPSVSGGGFTVESKTTSQDPKQKIYDSYYSTKELHSTANRARGPLAFSKYVELVSEHKEQEFSKI